MLMAFKMEEGAMDMEYGWPLEAVNNIKTNSPIESPEKI